MKEGSWPSCAFSLLALLPGCLILPETEKTQVRSYEQITPLKEDAPARPEVTVTPRGLALDVAATWRRTCTAWRYHIVEYREETSARLWAMDCSGDCGKALAVGLIVAPLTLLVSGIATGIIVSRSDDTMRREVKSYVPLRSTCDAPAAGFRLRAAVPGQPDVPATTDEYGRALVQLPPPTAATASQPITVHIDAPPGVPPIVIPRGPPGAR
ncbi:MAG TPA: hypothetical protein VFU21_20045 [Kofleriaceae bacterium]|nr:hypothetical protein [Kofleriaceae bacterium]